MSQQMKGNSRHEGSVTITVRDTNRYAVVNPPFTGKHLKPQDERSLQKRKLHWEGRKEPLPCG